MIVRFRMYMPTGKNSYKRTTVLVLYFIILLVFNETRCFNLSKVNFLMGHT